MARSIAVRPPPCSQTSANHPGTSISRSSSSKCHRRLDEPSGPAMPELPELEIIKEVLQRRVVGETIADVEIRPPGGPIVVRDLTGEGFAAGLTGQIVSGVSRRGKFLLFDFRESPRHLAINPKLTGRLQLAEPGDKKLPKTHIIFTLGNGRQLRYIDQKQMGQLYLTENPDMIP